MGFLRAAQALWLAAEPQSIRRRAVSSRFRAYNFVQATSRIATSGVVPLDEFPAIAAAGYRSVINLLPDDSQYAQPGEASTVRGLGMAYVHIPIDIDAPTLENYQDFEDAMESSASAPVWVHCAANWRVSAFFSVYAQCHLGWSAVDATEFVHEIWEPTQPWLDLAHRVLHRGSERLQCSRE